MKGAGEKDKEANNDDGKDHGEDHCLEECLGDGGKPHRWCKIDQRNWGTPSEALK